jgi:hypothetical protein
MGSLMATNLCPPAAISQQSLDSLGLSSMHVRGKEEEKIEEIFRLTKDPLAKIF